MMHSIAMDTTRDHCLTPNSSLCCAISNDFLPAIIGFNDRNFDILPNTPKFAIFTLQDCGCQIVRGG